MHKLAILLKTFDGDLKYVERLIPSYNKYNVDNIPLYIVVPESDIKVFKQFVNCNIEILSEEVFKDRLTSVSVGGFKPGYINQEIIKLSFWEEELCENYFCLDSDGEFIRDFYVSDFMYDDCIPYSILIEDNELKVEPEYYKAYWVPREEKIRRIQKEVGLVDNRMLTCHGMAILSSKVLESFKKDFLEPRNMSYLDILEISPYEFSWYNMWLQKTEVIPIKFREPLFKFFHHENHLKDYLRRGTNIDDIARGFIGININSNWQINMGVDKPISYQDYVCKEKSIEDVPLKKLVYAIIIKIKNKIRVVPLFGAVFNDTVGNKPRRREERQEKKMKKAFAGFVSLRVKSMILQLHSTGRLPKLLRAVNSCVRPCWIWIAAYGSRELSKKMKPRPVWAYSRCSSDVDIPMARPRPFRMAGVGLTRP